MSFQIQIVKTDDFVRFDAQGDPDLPKSRAALEAIARTCVERKVACALLDIRGGQGHLSLADLYQLAAVFGEVGFTHEHRVAILHKYSGRERAEFFAVCTASKG